MSASAESPNAGTTGQAHIARLSFPTSPRSGAASAPVSHVRLAHRSSPRAHGRPVSFLGSQLPSSSPPSSPLILRDLAQPPQSPSSSRRRRTNSFNSNNMASPHSPSGRKIVNDSLAKAQSRDAQKVNDSMVYLDGPQVYTCAQCRTHLTSHDDIISKSFHGRHGRAYLFDQCVNVTIGPAEDRTLITGLHSVCDIFCKRCTNLVGWTYQKAYAASQKYKEGKFIIEKINLHLEESDYYDVAPPAGERSDRWRKRSMSWGSECSASQAGPMVYEYPLPPDQASASGGDS